MKSESMDTSLETATDVVRTTAKQMTPNAAIRNLAIDILHLGFQNQFEEDRESFRAKLNEVISAAATEGVAP